MIGHREQIGIPLLILCVLVSGFLGNRSRRYSTSYIPIVVRRSTAYIPIGVLALFYLENVFQRFSTSFFHGVVPHPCSHAGKPESDRLSKIVFIGRLVPGFISINDAVLQ